MTLFDLKVKEEIKNRNSRFEKYGYNNNYHKHPSYEKHGNYHKNTNSDNQ